MNKIKYVFNYKYLKIISMKIVNLVLIFIVSLRIFKYEYFKNATEKYTF